MYPVIVWGKDRFLIFTKFSFNWALIVCWFHVKHKVLCFLRTLRLGFSSVHKIGKTGKIPIGIRFVIKEVFPKNKLY